MKWVNDLAISEPFDNKCNMIHYAVCEQEDELLKIFVPFVKNPNAPDQEGWTPIQRAAFGLSCRKNANILNILIPLSENPNAPDPVGWTPIQRAAYHGHVEVMNILAPLSDNPNAPGLQGFTPIQTAARNGNFEIIKILAPFVAADNLNNPDPNGVTPVHHVKMLHRQRRRGPEECSEIIKILSSNTDRLPAPAEPERNVRQNNSVDSLRMDRVRSWINDNFK